MAKTFFVVVAVLALAGLSISAQSKPTIQGVWRVVERTTTGPNGATNKNPQPSLYFFTGKHYSSMQIVSNTPRPIRPLPAQNAKITDADKIATYAEWQPFNANAGTYEVKGATLVTRPLVAKSTAVMANQTGALFAFKIDGNTLSLTQITGATGDKAANPTTIRLVRVE